MWIPSHTGITQNEEADQQGKKVIERAVMDNTKVATNDSKPYIKRMDREMGQHSK